MIYLGDPSTRETGAAIVMIISYLFGHGINGPVGIETLLMYLLE